MSMREQLVTQIGTYVIAAILLVMTGVLAYHTGNVPMWLVGFDGMALAFVYGTGQSFVQARTAQPTSNALRDTLDRYHELAMHGTRTVSRGQSGGTAPTGGNA